MRKTLAAGLIVTLISSNIIIGHTYIQTSRNYESKLEKQGKNIEILKKNLHDSTQIDEENQHKIHVLTDELNQVKNELNQTKNELIKSNNDNENLKKQLSNKKEVMQQHQQKQLNMTLTFYGADCSGCSGTTATGIDVSNTIYYKGLHVVAADPRVIPLHSVIKIETDSESFLAYVGDTGSAIKGNILDVLVSSEAESYKYGRQTATVTILKEGEN